MGKGSKRPVPQGGTGKSVPKAGKQSSAVGGSGPKGRAVPPGCDKMGPKKGNP